MIQTTQWHQTSSTSDNSILWMMSFMTRHRFLRWYKTIWTNKAGQIHILPYHRIHIHRPVLIFSHPKVQTARISPYCHNTSLSSQHNHAHVLTNLCQTKLPSDSDPGAQQVPASFLYCPFHQSSYQLGPRFGMSIRSAIRYCHGGCLSPSLALNLLVLVGSRETYTDKWQTVIIVNQTMAMWQIAYKHNTHRQMKVCYNTL